MHTISGSNLNVVVYGTVPRLLAAAWYPVVCQEIYLNYTCVEELARQDTMHGDCHVWVEDFF
jgi:hypothetical protein